MSRPLDLPTLAGDRAAKLPELTVHYQQERVVIATFRSASELDAAFNSVRDRVVSG